MRQDEVLPDGTPRVLELPLELIDDPTAFEILRLWAQGGKQTVLLRGLHIKDRREWGILLADLARHVARSYELNFGDDPEETVRIIREVFSIEVDNPTDLGTGHLRE